MKSLPSSCPGGVLAARTGHVLRRVSETLRGRRRAQPALAEYLIRAGLETCSGDDGKVNGQLTGGRLTPRP